MSESAVNLAAEARRLRTEEGLSARQIQQRLGLKRDQLREWLRGVPPPEWTRRPNAKDGKRQQAEELRRLGWSVPEIATELDVAKSTAFQWVRHLPLDPDTERARKKREHAKLMSDAQWAAWREAREAEHAAVNAAGAAWVGELSHRELLVLGAVCYWCEGAKSKPWRQQYVLIFTNSDPVLIELFLAFMEALGISRTTLKYRVSIHQSADAAQATEWWAERIGVRSDTFQRPTIKRHKPTTNRQNIGVGYRGCLVVSVPRGRELYWQIEGIMQGLERCESRVEVG